MNKKIKISSSKYFLLAAIFVVTAVITFISMNFEAAEMYTTTMKTAALPVMDMKTDGGMSYNRLHGYTAAIDASLLNESITPLSSNKKLSISINTYGSTIKAISYKVRSAADNSLIENTEVPAFDQNGNQADAVLNIKNLIEDNTEYLLEVVISTDSVENISYYTRIVSGTDIKLDNKFKFVLAFNGYTFDKTELNNISSYIETSSEGNNTNFGKVNINCTQAQIGWGDLNPMVESEIVPVVKDITNDVAIIYLEYNMGAANDYDSYDTYKVGEYYRVRQTASDMYLLNFEREANQVLDGKNDLTSSSKINFGINADTDVNMLADISGVYSYFVNQGALWCFNSKEKTFSNVFTFSSDESDNVREQYQRHNFKIMNVTDKGDCNFLLYGYMNRGEHEGQVGVSLCSYKYESNQVTEKLFLPVNVPYEIMADNVGGVSYLADNNVFYLLMDDSLYSIDLESKEVMVEVDGLIDGTYAASDSGSSIAYSTNGKLYESDEVRVFNMANNTDYYIKAEDGVKLRALGYIGADFIYGMAYDSDILKDQSGIITFPMYQLNIMDDQYNIIKEYVPEGAYVSDTSVDNMRITLSRIVKNGEGGYDSTSIDQLINRDENNTEAGLLTETNMSTDRKQELYIILMTELSNNEGVSLRYSKEVVFNNEATPDIEYNFTGQNRYYVYGYGTFRGSYTNLVNAINKAYDNYGKVIDYNGREIWSRYKTSVVSINGYSSSPCETSESLEYSVEALSDFSGSRLDIVSIMESGVSAKDALNQAVDGKAIVVKGVAVEKMLNFISSGQPVIAKNGSDSYVVITGYDSTNLMYVDTASGSSVTEKITDANKKFAEWGNLFITYYR